MKRNFFLILLVLIFLIGTYIYTNQTHEKFKTELVTDKQFAKRLAVTQRDNLNFIYYSNKIKNLLAQIPESDLANIKCSDGIIRTVDGAYVFETDKTETGEKRLVQDTKYLEFMRDKESAYPGRKRLLASRVCEVEKKFLMIFYTIGSYDTKAAETLSPRLLVLSSSDNESLVQVITNQAHKASNKLIGLRKSKTHVRCDQPFQMGIDGSLMLLCSEKDDFISTFRTIALNINDGSSRVLETCINKYKDGLITSCQ